MAIDDESTRPQVRVTTQNRTMMQGPGGQPVEGVEVAWETSDGHTGATFVTAAEYRNLDVVRDKIRADASHVSTIGALTIDL